MRAGKTIDTDARRKAMKAKQSVADRKKAEAAKAKAKKLAEANKAAAAKAKAAAVAEKKRKAEARKANQAKYNAMNKTVGGSSKHQEVRDLPDIDALSPAATRRTTSLSSASSERRRIEWLKRVERGRRLEAGRGARSMEPAASSPASSKACYSAR